MSYSRRFAFFEKVPLSVDKVERSFQDLPVTCVTSGGGYLWLGDADGFMHCLDSTFCLSSFRAHTSGPVRHCRQVPGTEHLVVTVGASSEDRDEKVCVWNTKKWSLTSKTSLPVCCRSVKATVGAPQPGGRSLGEVVCLEVAATLDVVLLGHSGGAVQLIKGDITSDRHCRRLVLHEFAVPVTGLHYVPATSSNPKRQKANLEEFLRASSRHIVEQLSPETSVKSADVGPASPVVGSSPSGPTSPYVFACSEGQIVSITLGKRDEPVRTNILDSFGCRANCSCLLTDPQKPGHPNLVMAHKEALYFYDVDGRGPCIAIEGDKRAICSYKNYLVSIRLSGAQRPPDSQPGFPDPQSSVSLFEFKNKFIGGDFVIPWAHSIIADLGSLFVLCLEADAARGTNSVKIVELVEKDTQSKLDILFSRKSFNLAIGMAESDNHSKEELAQIHRRYADHLFSQKQYDMAVKEYIQTIGTVEASYVVLRFLESGLINHLTRYLEALHLPENVARGCLTKDHTALLLNSYARLDDSERIDAFLRTLANQPHIDSDFFACINVLRRAGYPHQALTLARLTSNTADCIQILAEDLKDAEAVLAEINALPFEQALEAVCTHGTFLMQSVPVETAEILDKLCSNPKGGRISAQHFIKIFVNNRTGLMKFLERYIQKVHSIDAAVLNSVETLLELALYEADAISDDAACEDKEAQVAHLHGLVMRLLKHSKFPYDEGKALILCKQRNFIPGCLYIWTKNKQYDQILEHYVLENDFESIMRTCEEYGDEAPFLWFEAFKYTVDKPELGDKLPAILSQLEARNLASPLVVLKFLSSVDAKKCHTFGSIKAYILRYLKSSKAEIDAKQAEMQRLREETLRNREVVRQSKTRVKIFQQQKCAVCSQALDPPSVHFLCDHSYHKSCFDTYSSEDQLCPECAPLIRQRQVEAENAASVLPTAGSVRSLDQLQGTLGGEQAGLSVALGKLIGGGVMEGGPAHGIAAQLAPPPPPPPPPLRPPSKHQPKRSVNAQPTPISRPSPGTSKPTNPFDNVGRRHPVAAVASVADSGRGGSIASTGQQHPARPPPPTSVDSAVDVGLAKKPQPPSKSQRDSLNPFGEEVLDKEAAYPEHLNPF